VNHIFPNKEAPVNVPCAGPRAQSEIVLCIEDHLKGVMLMKWGEMGRKKYGRHATPGVKRGSIWAFAVFHPAPPRTMASYGWKS